VSCGKQNKRFQSPTHDGFEAANLIVHRLLRRSNALIRGRCCFLRNGWRQKSDHRGRFLLA
jgi:hypothetical protein